MVESWPISGVDLHLDLDPATGRRSGLEHALRTAIQTGRLTPGARLPATRKLATDLGLSRGTVRAAYDQLIAEGYLTARQGSATTVTHLPTPPPSPSQAQPHNPPVGPHAQQAQPYDLPVGSDPRPSRAQPHDTSVGDGPRLSQGHQGAFRAYDASVGGGGPQARLGGIWAYDEPVAARSWVRHDLRPGSPDVAGFPVAAWLRSARRALGSAGAEAYGYADPRGRTELREALAEYLGRARGVLAHPAQIVIVNGYVQALALLAEVLADQGKATIAMEDPGSAFHREVARRNGAVVIPLPVDDLGARADLLGSTPGLEEVHAVEVTPAHQYPTGQTLHPQRRRALVEWALTHHALVIENDYDGEFRYDRQPVGALQGTAPDHVAYLGTSSKTLGPGLRLAWMVLPPRLLAPVVEAKRHADHHTETLGQLTLADFITCHAYDRHIRTSRLRYQRRRDLLLARLRPLSERTAAGISLHGIAAGLHALISLPDDGPTEQHVLEAAATHELALGRLGDRWHTPEGHHPQGIILGYGTPPEHAYPAALDALDHTLNATL